MTDTKREFDGLRQEIAAVDAQIVRALDRRAKLSRDVARLRGDGPALLPVEPPADLEQVSGRTGDMPPESLRDIYREIRAACLGLELGVTVAFLGAVGGAGHAAARGRFGASTPLVPAESAAGAAAAVVGGRATFAVVPFETKSDGLVQSTLAALLGTELKVVATFEAVSAVQLVSRSGNVAEVERVYAAPSERAACRSTLDALGDAGRVSVIEVKTPEVACKYARDDSAAGALLEESYAASQDLAACQLEVHDGPSERVRYAVLGERPARRTGSDATLLAFSVSDSPGALLEVLRQFAERGVNLSKIQSRPTPGEAWSYLFFAELVGHATDRAVVGAVEEVRRQARFFKLLGTYAV